MNRLKKPRPGEPTTAAMSRTMQMAVSGMKYDSSNSTCTDIQRRDTWFSAPHGAAPRTKVEQYWAARALVAETLLSVRERHQDELAEVRRAEEGKRTTLLVMMVVVCLVIVVVVLIVLMIAPDRAKDKSSHFTIPILSPFASVVEHETGIFGTKAVAIFVLAIGVGVYAAIKHGLSQWPTR